MLNAFNGNVAEMEASMQVAEMWLRQGDNVTLGLSQLSQDMFYYYMNNDPSVREKGTIGEKLSVMWLKDGESYHTSKENSSVCFEDIYLPLNNVESSSTPGLYSFVVVKDYPGLDECSTPPSDKIVRTLAKTSVNIGGAHIKKISVSLIANTFIIVVIVLLVAIEQLHLPQRRKESISY